MLNQVRQDCTRCAEYDQRGSCKRFGPIPKDFMAVGCEEWSFDEVPF